MFRSFGRTSGSAFTRRRRIGGRVPFGVRPGVGPAGETLIGSPASIGGAESILAIPNRSRSVGKVGRSTWTTRGMRFGSEDR